jgi:cytochrome b subunit of formate dehydrogenase
LKPQYGVRWLAAVVVVGSLAAAASASDDCLACHEQSEVQKQKTGAHAEFACRDCHADAKGDPHPERLKRVECGECHDDVVGRYAKSVHGVARSNGTRDTPECRSCHGKPHEMLKAEDPASPVAKLRLADTCGSCHANPEFLARHKIPFARPVEAYRLSVHGRALARGEAKAPSCSDCHDAHGIRPARERDSKIKHWNVPATCGACHQAVRDSYAASVHGQAAAQGTPGAPVCTDCHGEHAILAPSEPGSLVNPARVSSVTCGRCHSDERLAARYNLPLDKVPAFQDSFHGLALRSGSQVVANCASCHGVHNILPASDPRSSVHPQNLNRTCGSCHAGAGERFAIGPVHVQPATESEHAVVRFVRVFYLLLIPLTIGGMVLHNGIDFVSKLARARPVARTAEELPRMNLQFRIAHWLVQLSFLTLVWTGFALKFPDAWWATPLLQWERAVAFRGLVHRAAGVLLIGALLYHAVHLGLRPRDRAMLRHVLPRLRDLRDAFQAVAHGLGLADKPPRFGVFSYAEKAEYLAFVWGSVIMAGSGLMLWFNDWTLRFLPKWVSDAATAVHWYEAILASLAILVWHFYMVIFDPDVYPMDRAWLTGRASAEHLRHTRPVYYRWLRRFARERATAPPAPPASG